MRFKSLPIPELSPRAFARFLASSADRPRVGCWLWSGEVNGDGYGKLFVAGHRYFAHRVAYALEHGATPVDRLVLHSCDNPRCTRATHLFLGDDGANSQDMASKGRHWLQRDPTGQQGEANPGAVLTDDAVLRARQEYALGGIELRILAARHGVSVGAMSLAVRGKTWRHVDGPIALGDQRNKTPHRGPNRHGLRWDTKTGEQLPHHAKVS